MSTVNYNLMLDEIDTQTAEWVFDQLGLTLSAGLNIYIKIVARQKKIPFELSLHDNSSMATLLSDIKNKEQSFNALKGILKGYAVDLDKEREERILSK